MKGTGEARGATVAALGALYARRYPSFLRVAEAIVGEVELAHDVVQEAFARLIRGRSGFRGAGTVEAWAWQAVVNTARNVRRDRPPPAVELPEIGAEESVQPDDRLRAVIAGLPERQRLVLFLRYYADLDYRGIAHALGIQPGTVGATLNQAHAAVRRLLEEVPT